MRKYLQLLVAMVATLFATNAMAFNPPASPKPAGNIVDQAHVLTQGELARLNTQLRNINNGSANEIGVLIVPSLGGENIRDVGYTTAKAWGVGKRDLDNGVMIVWSPGERKIGIETGKGVEGDLPDIKCSDIIRNTIGPNFRDKHYEQGLSQGFTAIAGAIEDHRAAVAENARRLAANPPSNHANDPTPQAVAPHPSSGGCDIAMQQAGLGSGLFWIVILAGAFWFLRSRIRAAHRREEEEINRELERQKQSLRQQWEAAQAQVRVPVHENGSVPYPTVVSAPRHVSPTVPVATKPTIPSAPPANPSPVVPVVTAAVVTAALAEERERQARLRQLDQERQEREREETRQARLQQLEDERRQREREDEAAAAAAAAAAIYVGTSSSSDDDSSSSSSGGGGWDGGGSSGGDSGGGGDFGGGDFGGGGASGDY